MTPDELPTPQDYAAVADGTTDDTAAVAAAIAAEKDLRLVGDYNVTTFANDYGVPLRGPGRILKAGQQLNSRVDAGRHVFGQEYLYAFHSKLLAGTPAKMVFSGDSTTQGGPSPPSPNFLIHAATLNLGLARGHRLTAVNAGHSGKDSGQWVSTYLSPDLALNPDLYVVRWGINDPYNGRSLQDYTKSLRSGLATIRACSPLSDMSILLMVPNSTSDTPNGRDEKWYEQIRKVVRQAARDYHCACIDTYALWRDSRPAAGLWMDDAFGDGRALHPHDVMNAWIASTIGDLLFPAALDPPLQGAYTPTYANVSNVSGFIAQPCYWSRSGNNVTVFGRVDIACVAGANALTRLAMSLPVPTTFTTTSQLGGGGGIGQPTYQPFLCIADTTNNRATLQFLSNGTTSAAAFFQFTYLVS